MKKLLLMTLLAGTSVPAYAQTEPGEAEANGLEDIVVTATRREESVQDIATSVTVFTEATLAASSIVNTVDLQARTPGLVFSTNGSSGQPYIRGVGTDIIGPGSEAPVAVYVDGAYQTRASASVADLYDVQRIEILKGPQGALYGRNATAGALNIISNAPTDAFGLDASVLYGDYDRVLLRGAVNIPLGDGVAARVAGFYVSSDGYSVNAFRGTPLGGEGSYGFRGSLRVQPGDTLTLSFVGEYLHEDSSRNSTTKLIVAPGLPAPAIGNAPLFGYAPPVVPADPRIVKHDFQVNIHGRQYRLNFKADWELGFADLQAISGYTNSNTGGQFDLDGTEVAYSFNHTRGTSRLFTQSLQLTSAGQGPVRWIAGADYFRERATQNFDGRLFGFLFPAGTPLSGPSSPITGIIWDPSLRANGWSVYADLQYDIAPDLRLIASGRYGQERRNAIFNRTYLDPFGILLRGAAQSPVGTVLPGLGTVTNRAGGVIFFTDRPRVRFKRFTPKLAVELRPREDVLLHASATNGFKSGGLNLLNNGEAFDPEKIWSYEAGVKASWLDRKLRTNLTGFFYDYKDLQVIRFDGLANNVGNADAHIYGAELEVEARPAPELTFDANVAYLHARYTDYPTRDSNRPALGIINIRGNVLPKSPEFTVMAGITYQVPLAELGDLSFRGEARTVSSLFFDQFQTAALKEDGYTVVNGRVTFKSADGRYSLAVFGRNLFDVDYLVSMVRVDSFFGTLANYGAPRTFGIEAGVSF